MLDSNFELPEFILFHSYNRNNNQYDLADSKIVAYHI